MCSLNEKILAAALLEWEKSIESARNQDVITGYFDANGWRAWLRSQPGCEGGYVRRVGSGVDYCGHFLGAMGAPYDIANKILPSTYRIHATKDPRIKKYPPIEVRRADIITVVTGKNKSYGDHFCIVESVDGDFVHTVEGNASGTLPSGKRGHGVVKNRRAVSSVRCVYRLTTS